MTVTPEGLTIVAADHSVTSYNLASGNATAYPAAGTQAGMLRSLFASWYHCSPTWKTAIPTPAPSST